MVPKKKKIRLYIGEHRQARIKNPKGKEIKKTQEKRKACHVLLDI